MADEGASGSVPSTSRDGWEIFHLGLHSEARPSSSITLTPDPVNIKDGPQTITVDAVIADPTAGLKRWVLAIYKPDGTQASNQFFFPPTPLSGTLYNGVFRATYEVPTGAPTGTWSLVVTLVDNLHNTAVHGGATGLPFPHGPAEGTFEVVATSGIDYAAWASAFFTAGEMATLGALGADPDADGNPNGIEAAAGTHPRQAASRSIATAVINQTGGPHLTLQFQRAESLPGDLVLTVQTNPNLESGTWTTHTQKTGNGPWSNSAIVAEGSPAGGRVAVTIHGPAGTGSRHFMRLKVNR